MSKMGCASCAAKSSSAPAPAPVAPRGAPRGVYGTGIQPAVAKKGIYGGYIPTGFQAPTYEKY